MSEKVLKVFERESSEGSFKMLFEYFDNNKWFSSCNEDLDHKSLRQINQPRFYLSNMFKIKNKQQQKEGPIMVKDWFKKRNFPC